MGYLCRLLILGNFRPAADKIGGRYNTIQRSPFGGGNCTSSGARNSRLASKGQSERRRGVQDRMQLVKDCSSVAGSGASMRSEEGSKRGAMRRIGIKEREREREFDIELVFSVIDSRGQRLPSFPPVSQSACLAAYNLTTKAEEALLSVSPPDGRPSRANGIVHWCEWPG